MLSLELDNTSLSGRLLVVNDYDDEEEEEDDSEEENSNIFSHFRSQHLFHGLAVKVYMWMLILTMMVMVFSWQARLKKCADEYVIT